MSLNAIKARYGAIPDSTLERVRQNSPASYRLLTEDFPKLIGVVEAASKLAQTFGTGPDGVVADDDFAVELDAALKALDSGPGE